MRHRRDWVGSTGLMPVEMVPRTGIIEGLVFTALASNALTFSLAGSAFAISAISAIAVTAAVVGLQYLLAPKPPRPEDGRAPQTQAMPARIFGIGRNRVAGAYMLWEEKDGRLFAVQALCGHPISAITRYYLHDDIVTLDGQGWVDATEVDDGRYGAGWNIVKLEHRLGAVPETPYAEHVEHLGSEGIWTNNHRGDGQASLGMICISPRAEHFQGDFPYGIPQPSVVAEMARMWDFRDPSQNPDNPATWQFSRNPAVALVWQECFNPFGPQQDYRKAILPVIDQWREEADICDEPVALAGGSTEPRYRVDGWATTETDPVAVQNSILAACDGHLVRRGNGSLIFTVGKFREDLVETITDADIVGHTMQGDYAEEESLNRLVPKFTYPATDYTTTDTDYFEDTAAQVKDGRILSRDASFEWVQSWRQARRLGKREWLRRQQKLQGTLNLRLSGINAAYARWVRLETPVRFPNLNGKIIENRRSILALMQGGFQMDCIKHPDDIDAWNPATDEGAVPPIPARPNSAELPVPVIDSVAAIPSSGSVFLRVMLVEPARDNLTPVVQWRVAGGSWVTQVDADAEPVGGLIQIDTGLVPNNATVDVRAAWQGTGSSRGDWSPIEQVQAIVDTTPPAPVTDVSASGGAGAASLIWRAPNSQNFVATHIYRNVTNNPGAAVVVRTEYGSPSSPHAWTDTALGAGTYFYWLRSVNGSGLEGTAVATGSVSVT